MRNSLDHPYFNNLLSQLDLRLFSCLGYCDEGRREAAHDLIVSVADHPVEAGFIPLEDEAEAYRRLYDAVISGHDALLKAAEDGGVLPAVEQLRERFGLSPDELFLLTAVLAPYADPRFGRIYRAFQGSEEPRMDFLLSLLEPDGMRKYEHAALLGRDGHLSAYGLIVPAGGDGVRTASTVFLPGLGILEWLNGVRSTEYYEGRAEWLRDPRIRMPRADYTAIIQAVKMAGAGNEPVPVVSFYGPDMDLLFDHAETFAAGLGCPILKLDLNGLPLSRSVEFLRIGLRDAALDQCAVLIYGIDGWFENGAVIPSEVGQTLEGWQIPVVMLTDRPVVFPQGKKIADRLNLRVSVEKLTGTQRFGVWKKMLEKLPLDGSLDDAALRTLAGQFSLSSSQIRAAVNAGLGTAVLENRDLRVEDLYEGARVSSMHHLSDLAKKMTAKYTLRDLVLPDKQKNEIDKLIAMARNRSLVLEDWGVGKKLVSGRGISALFTGVPGTGKTLSAQVIAGELGLEIYRVDLSTIVSKYIGETEKNLERIFSEAQNSNVILFFDEADSLFGRRSEVSDSHDRYANIEVGYLLQRIETYDGIVLMATNLGANLDEAFARRINFIIDFPFPDEETRLRLWKLLLPDNIDKDPDIDLAPFASVYKIAGGGIRNAVVWAIYESANNKRPLSRADLLHGVEREYQKMGKVFISIG